MEWNLNVPKILHVYWGGGVMHYLRFMTVKSFMNHNPDWVVMFWYPKFPNVNIPWSTGEQDYDLSSCRDFTLEMHELPIIIRDVDFEEFGFSNDMSEVHKSDYLRLELLSTYGGLWSDMDILYFRSMNDLYFNKIENNNIETFYCNNKYGHSAGFLMSCENNKFFSKLSNFAKKSYLPKYYQSMGALVYNKYFPKPASINRVTPALNISMDVVYRYDASRIPDLLKESALYFTTKSIGIHWYGGDKIWKDYMVKTNGGFLDKSDSIISKILKSEKRYEN